MLFPSTRRLFHSFTTTPSSFQSFTSKFHSSTSLLSTEIINKRASEQQCLSLLETCNSLSKLTQIHAHLLKSGLHNNPLVLTKFSSTSAILKSITYAASVVFSNDADTRLYDSFLFNTIIRAYAQTDDLKQNAISSYILMLRSAIPPNKFTFPFVLKASAGLSELNLGTQIHGSVVKFGFDNDVYVQNTMVNMYACCVGGIEFAREVFDRMPDLTPVSWSTMIGGYARLGRSNEAVALFRDMQAAGVKADEVTMVSVLSACADLGALELGKWVEFYIEKEGVAKTNELCNALIDMFAKCGDVDEAVRVFRKMNGKTIVSWTSVIVGLAMHGRALEAVSFFEEMTNAGVAPDAVAFIGLLSACSHAGLVEEGCRYFNSMFSSFDIVPKIEHYGCMVDLFSRAGLVQKALEFVSEMPVEPNPVIWRTLINVCRSHGMLELSESMTKRLIGDEPAHGSNYVLLSNIYAKMCKWEKKSKIRQVMDKKGMRKVPGCSMIELNNNIYEFDAGDKAHDH